MNKGQFEAQTNEAWKVIKGLELDVERNYFPDYAHNTPTDFKQLTYTEIWKAFYRNQCYNFLLNDRALIQLRADSFRPLKVSYSYLECPFEGVTYSEFVQQELEEDIQEVRDALRPEYENYLLSCNMKESITPIRYDYDPDRYTEGSHPASHVHFGHKADIRVGTFRILRPLSFVLFIVRQCYRQSWQSLLTMVNAENWCRNVRDSLNQIDSSFINKLDHWEMMLY